jgi:hypothetical protein
VRGPGWHGPGIFVLLRNSVGKNRVVGSPRNGVVNQSCGARTVAPEPTTTRRAPTRVDTDREVGTGSVVVGVGASAVARGLV